MLSFKGSPYWMAPEVFFHLPLPDLDPSITLDLPLSYFNVFISSQILFPHAC